MTPAETWLPALAITAVLAVVARWAGAVTTSGALAGIAVGGAVSLGFGLPGLGGLGAFFVLGSVATKVGWGRKERKGTAEATGGARDGARVVGKGGVAALAALLAALGSPVPGLAPAFVGALAAALGDTLGTEIGTLARGQPRSLPTFRSVPAGTPGAVSVQGTLATAAGAAAVAAVAALVGLLTWPLAAWVAVAGFAAAMLESLVTSIVPDVRAAPGWTRNLFTTGAGALLGALFAHLFAEHLA